MCNSTNALLKLRKSQSTLDVTVFVFFCFVLSTSYLLSCTGPTPPTQPSTKLYLAIVLLDAGLPCRIVQGPPNARTQLLGPLPPTTSV